jgi:predicted class III extradiol MEMO1 family dioxygenase
MKLTDTLHDYANMLKTVIIITTDMHHYACTGTEWSLLEDSQLDHIKLTVSTIISITICS